MRRIFSFALILILIAGNVRAEGLPVLQKGVDWTCISPEVIGPCPKEVPPYVGIRVRYWEPVLLVETVKKPGDSVVDELGSVVSSLVTGESTALLGQVLTSGSTSQSVTRSNMQFNEAHIFSFPFSDIFSSLIQFSCPASNPDSPISIKYLSELDAAEWRIGLIESLSPQSLMGIVCLSGLYDPKGLCMGTWGPVYPRTGFFIHQSEVVGSAANAFRAVSISSLQGIFSHVVLSPVMFVPDVHKDKLQLIYPAPGGCIKIGENPLFWETAKTSMNGKYLWVYWRYRECCV